MCLVRGSLRQKLVIYLYIYFLLDSLKDNMKYAQRALGLYIFSAPLQTYRQPQNMYKQCHFICASQFFFILPTPSLHPFSVPSD